jgi:signal transduction histidine kinase
MSAHLSGQPQHSPAVLTTAAQVRSLTAEEAARAVSVRLRGVFMGEADPKGIAFVVQDDTDGIYVQGPPALVAGLKRGDFLDIEGVTDPGGFAPYVAASDIRYLGKASIPEPMRITFDQLSSGQMDAKWIEVVGIVRSVEPKTASDSASPPPGTRFATPSAADTGPPEFKLKLASGGLRLLVQVSGEMTAEDLVDAEVRVRGLCFNLHNHNRQFVRPFVQVPRDLGLVIERAPRVKPFAGEPRPIASLLQFQQLSGEQGHREHIRGVVVHHRPGTALWVRDGDRSLRVDTAQREFLQPGDEVDVIGFPALRDYSAVMEDAVFRRVGTQPVPSPHVLTALPNALQHDADLVQVDGRLTDVRKTADGATLSIDWQGNLLRAQILLPEGDVVPTEWQPGARVRVSGVCSVVTGGVGPLGGLWEPQSFELLLRSRADLAVLQPPPWWTARRVAWVLASFLALAIGGMAAVMLASRRRLRDQENRRAMAEAEFTAILNERNRVAREIHDTLSQSLGAICVQLELARGHANEISAGARNHLGSALKLARDALADARESIWNMRSQVLEQGDLGDALAGILRQLTEGTGVKSRLRVDGDRRRLPPVVENNLLRIGQEAITNASKHAQAKRIDVTVAFDRRTVSVAVEDDGVGFVSDASKSDGRRSFGLVGIKERAELLGGTVEVRSVPGQGTNVVVAVSV